MDQNIKNFIFSSHFNPDREPKISGVKPCPFCGSIVFGKSGDNIVCFRCGKVFPKKEKQIINP